jgi:hypothetical protein
MSVRPTHTVSAEAEPIDWQLLQLIFEAHEIGRPWTKRELTRRFLAYHAADDSLVRLHWNGLVCEIGHYVMPTTAAIYLDQLDQLDRDPRQLRLPLSEPPTA